MRWLKFWLCSMALTLAVGCGQQVPEKHVQPDADPGVVKAHVDSQVPDASNGSDFRLEPAVSVLEGTLHQVTFFGPPGYGADPETDAQEKGYVLKLREPISVTAEGSASPAAEGVIEIQLLTQDPNIAKYKGLRMRMTGPLQLASADNPMPVVMQVQRFLEL